MNSTIICPRYLYETSECWRFQKWHLWFMNRWNGQRSESIDDTTETMWHIQEYSEASIAEKRTKEWTRLFRKRESPHWPVFVITSGEMGGWRGVSSGEQEEVCLRRVGGLLPRPETHHQYRGQGIDRIESLSSRISWVLQACSLHFVEYIFSTSAIVIRWFFEIIIDTSNKGRTPPSRYSRRMMLGSSRVA